METVSKNFDNKFLKLQNEMDEKHLENEKKYRDKTNMFETNVENLKL